MAIYGIIQQLVKTGAILITRVIISRSNILTHNTDGNGCIGGGRKCLVCNAAHKYLSIVHRLEISPQGRHTLVDALHRLNNVKPCACYSTKTLIHITLDTNLE